MGDVGANFDRNVGRLTMQPSVRFLPDRPPPTSWRIGQPLKLAPAQNARRPQSATANSADLPDWWHAAGRAPILAIGAAGLFSFCIFALTAGRWDLLAILALLGWLYRRWRGQGMEPQAAPQGAQTLRAAHLTGEPLASAGSATNNVRRTSPLKVLLKAYLRGFLAYLSTLFLLTAIAHGAVPQSGFWMRVNTFIPSIYLALVILPALRPLILVLVRAAQKFGIRRGFADAGIGGALAGIYLVMDLVAMSRGANKQ